MNMVVLGRALGKCSGWDTYGDTGIMFLHPVFNKAAQEFLGILGTDWIAFDFEQGQADFPEDTLPDPTRVVDTIAFLAAMPVFVKPAST